jgi:hypothetical protein
LGGSDSTNHTVDGEMVWKRCIAIKFIQAITEALDTTLEGSDKAKEGVFRNRT